MPSESIPHGQQRPNVATRHANQSANSPEQSRSFEDIMLARSKPLYGMTPFRANYDERLTCFEFRVFSTMCGFANNETHLCWPKQKTLAELLHTSVSQISQTIARLVEFGYVEIQKFGFPARNVYRIIWEIPPKSAENIFPNIGETAEAADETCLPATEFTPGETQTLPVSKHRVYRGVKSLNIPIKQTNGTSSSEGSYLPTSPAQRAENRPSGDAAPLARTRERFDPSALRRDPLYVALCAYLPEPTLAHEWKRWAFFINQLHAQGVTAAGIATAVKGWQLRWDISKLTLPGLVNNWTLIRDGKTGDEVAKAIRHQKRDAAEAERAAERARREPDDRAEIERIERELFGE